MFQSFIWMHSMRFPEMQNLPDLEAYLKLTLDGFDLLGRGVAGVESVYSIPQWRITFDTGRAPQFAYSRDVLALSHFHLDHAGALPFYLGLRCLNNLKPLQIVLPDQKLSQAEQFLSQLLKISESDLRYDLIPASRGVFLKKDLELRSIAAEHCTECTGYGVWQKRSTLKREYQNLSSAEIVEAKKRGDIVSHESETLLFAYSGDSTARFLMTEAVQAEVLLMECSFFGSDVDQAKIKHYGHTHLDDWVAAADRFQNQTIIMTHTSQRYTRSEIESACKRALPAHILDRLVIFR